MIEPDELKAAALAVVAAYNADLFLYCPGACKSAGTLVALGAHALIMDHFSELGPLDVQMVKDDELFVRKSGLLASSAFEALAQQTFQLYEQLMVGIKIKSAGQVSFKLASELAAKMTAESMGQLYAQMNPDVIGSERRSLRIASRYGDMLAEEADNCKTGHTVEHLVSCYPSHDFVIDDTEARTLFKRVLMPSEELYELTGALGKIAQTPTHQTVVLPLTFNEDEDDGTDVASGDATHFGGTSPLDEIGTEHSGGVEEQEVGNDGQPQPSAVTPLRAKQ